ncbi:sporulation protein YunB [Peribacillus deserti]|uniref:Sporulation protein YunB n=1 Tax=Peribacillus deserti TaxID=673318 RepID=A0A2N5M8I8_9BACI|nr:sporulation protein YunB [Peribacillus deserti]PLT30666.1 sporulation protein YunB [Peribacillus deserti]
MYRKNYRSKLAFFRGKGPLPARLVFLYSFILFMISCLFSVILIDQAIEPIIINIAKSEIKRVSSEVINESIDENIAEHDMEDLIIVHFKDEGKTPAFSFNPKIYNSIRSSTTKDIQRKLGINEDQQFYEGQSDKVDSDQFKSLVYNIPLGVVTHNSLLASLGPKIPVRMSLIGNVEPDFKTKFTDAGINNTYLELFAHFKINVQIVIPSYSEKMLVEQEISLGGIFVPGDVPDYYSEDGGKSPAPAIVKPASPKK